MGAAPQPRFFRLGETGRPQVTIIVDGIAVQAFVGDTLLVAVLTHSGKLRRSEFGGTARAGFCLMAACQDCWVWTVAGERLRACDTPVEAGLSIVTEQPDGSWPNHA
jgi:predicted molibdopterin-dependent oxidoreductase YjgC